MGRAASDLPGGEKTDGQDQQRRSPRGRPLLSTGCRLLRRRSLSGWVMHWCSVGERSLRGSLHSRRNRLGVAGRVTERGRQPLQLAATSPAGVSARTRHNKFIECTRTNSSSFCRSSQFQMVAMCDPAAFSTANDPQPTEMKTPPHTANLS